MSSDSKTWALLIGIDHYPMPYSSLHGCKNDVDDVSLVLRENLQVPPENILTFVSPNGVLYQDPASSPTRANVVAALKKITDEASEGDFVYIHYSGHGDRVKTARPDLKTAMGVDEVLCTLEADITDVEFGGFLDTMAEKGLLVLAVLDCCHSGGADRNAQTAEQAGGDIANIRRRRSHHQDAKTRGWRNAEIVQSWFHRNRYYNFIAACQTHQHATECTINNRTNGVLTHYFIQALKSFDKAASPITYQGLQSVLDAMVRRSGRHQQPIHLGPLDRIIFGASGSAPASSVIMANVTGIDHDLKSLFLDKGTVAGVCVGDIYDVYRPGQSFLGLGFNFESEPFVRVVVEEVESLNSKATQNPGVGVGTWSDITVGWFAKLFRRANAATVVVSPSPQGSRAMGQLQREWDSYVDLAAPVYLHFDPASAPAKADLVIGIDDSSHFELRDHTGNTLPNIPRVSVDDEDMTERVMKVVKHISSFQTVRQLQHPAATSPPSHNFNLTPEIVPKEYKEQGVLSAQKVEFTNHHNKVLYITILDLSAAYGVSQVFPSQDADSHMVEPGKSIESFTVDFWAPEMLKDDAIRPDFEMTDVLKVIITTEKTNFRHFILPDMDKDLKPRKLRTASIRTPITGSWFVEDRVVISRGPAVKGDTDVGVL
ncbi:caspase domain-containing protein [Podospora didyma]|uniref:Caspase domain-containing protein n=1 Tax=Podospora didyma TaxID=330526 RepID=A0AAE0KJK9_9PEZI|nr:caspase domain-containing protein [Podospora didyma]